MLAIPLFWYLFFLMTAATQQPSANGPMSSLQDCAYAQRQVDRELHPHKSACIEIPQIKQ